jgi:hypothetical protein
MLATAFVGPKAARTGVIAAPVEAVLNLAPKRENGAREVGK